LKQIKREMNKIAVFTSGGDSPGMNACIRAVARTVLWYKKEAIGIMHGYDGMIKNEFVSLDSKAVSNIIQSGGTILKTARSKEFTTESGMQRAYDNLKKQNIDGLIAIGGDGTFRGAVAFNKKFDIPFIGIPGTIDNDLFGTDYTIGFDTAVNTTLEAIDKIKDTAAAHDRLFFIEVMGRDTGYIALWTGIAGGVEEILLPETKTDVDNLIKLLHERKSKNKSTIVIVAEGDETGGAMKISEAVKKRIPDYDARVTILGHIQRGGSPTCFDRILATKLGVSAVEALLNGESNKMTGIVNNKITYTNLENAVKEHAPLDKDLVRYVKMLQ
jgi:6-phosphofructokinase 1